MPSFPQGAVDVLDAEAAKRAIEQIAVAPDIAVDLEYDAMHAFQAQLCFVQVSTGEQVFLFDTLSPGVEARSLAAAFADPSKPKFFHAAGGDLQFLSEAGVRVKGLFDTHRAVTLLGLPKVGLADLVLERFGYKLSKEHQQSDFSLRPMPDGIRDYIADDVRYLCELGRQIRDECRKADIEEEVELDCQRLADEANDRPDLADFKSKIPKGSLSNDQAHLAAVIAQQLHKLRLTWAKAANVPLGMMLSNAALVAIATKPPTNRRELQKARGVRGAFVREHGDEVLALLKSLADQQKLGALEPLPDDRGARDPLRKKREDALKQFRVEKATARKVTPSVVLPNPLVDALAKEPTTSLEALAALPYFGPKRVRLYGADLVGLLNRG